VVLFAVIAWLKISNVRLEKASAKKKNKKQKRCFGPKKKKQKTKNKKKIPKRPKLCKNGTV
jgi:hypothetical protein